MKRGLVGFSQFMGTSSMLSLGVVVGLGIWVLASQPVVMAIAGTESPIGIFLATVLFVPVILCLVARASEARGGYTLYAIVRRSGSPRFLFATGWLSLAGYISIAALMVESVGVRLSQQLELFADMEVPLIILVAPVTVIAGLSEVLAPNQHPALRSTTRWVMVGLVIALLGWITVFPPPVTADVQMPRFETTRWLTAVSLPAAGLWAIALLLDHRPQFRSSDRKLATVLVSSWLIAGLLSVWVSFLVLKHEDLAFRSEGIVDIVWARERIKLASSLLAYAFCIVTLVKCLTRATRLAGSMAVDGLLPQSFEQRESTGRLPGAVLVALSAIVSLLAAYWNNIGLVGVAATSVLWAALIAIGLGLQKKEAPRPSALRLPLHPLMPLLALGACAFFSVIVPNPAFAITIAWLALGFLVWPVFRRGGVITRVQSDSDEAVDSESADIPPRHDQRILVCLSGSKDDRNLVKIGEAIARARGGDLVALRVIALLEQMPRDKIRHHAEDVCTTLDALLTDMVGEDVDAYPVVRVAPTTESGVLETARLFSPELVLVHMPSTGSLADPDHTLFVEKALVTVAQPIVVVRASSQDLPRRIVAALAQGPDSTTVLEFGAALAKASSGTITAAHVHTPIEDEAVVNSRFDGILEKSTAQPERLLVEAEGTESGILDLGPEYDMLVMGCTRDRSATATLVGDGLTPDLVASWKGPLAIVREREAITTRWFKRAWHQAFIRLPTLTTGERAEVYSDMRHSAGADVDFFVLIVIASAIATFGLVQDSAAVIIGAMLVAPLMSPIVAISQGIVQGNLRMIRRSLSSTAKGSAVAIAVSTGFVLTFPQLTPTPEIMARTAPTLFDLGVGLAAGAAAAYGVSRKAVAAALPGTAISVALVPPLCVVGFGLASDRLDIGIGALLLFFTNLAAIVFVSAVVFLLLGFFPRDKDRHARARGAISLNLLVLAMLCIPLGVSSCHRTRVDSLEYAVETAFRTHAEARSMLMRNIDVDEVDGVFAVKAAVYSDLPVTQAVLEELRQAVEAHTGLRVDLEFLVVHADRLTSTSVPGGNPSAPEESAEGTGPEQR